MSSEWKFGAFIIALFAVVGVIIFVSKKPKLSDLEYEARQQAELIDTQTNGPKVRDTCAYRELLEMCLSKTPAGPRDLAGAGNDWDEVIEACADAASNGSWRRQAFIKNECR